MKNTEANSITLIENVGLIITGKELAQKLMEGSNFIETNAKPLQTFQFERQNFSTNDWIALTKAKEIGLDISIYDEGEEVDGVRLSAVEITLFDYLVGAKRFGDHVDARAVLSIFKECYYKHYKRFRDDLD